MKAKEDGAVEEESSDWDLTDLDPGSKLEAMFTEDEDAVPAQKKCGHAQTVKATVNRKKAAAKDATQGQSKKQPPAASEPSVPSASAPQVEIEAVEPDAPQLTQAETLYTRENAPGADSQALPSDEVGEIVLDGQSAIVPEFSLPAHSESCSHS